MPPVLRNVPEPRPRRQSGPAARAVLGKGCGVERSLGKPGFVRPPARRGAARSGLSLARRLAGPTRDRNGSALPSPLRELRGCFMF